MSECTHNCSTCGENCGERQEPQSLLKEHHPEAHIGKVYGIVSGKGGVGKSMVTSQLAVTMRRRGYQVGILDADVTGPSIPKAFGVHGQAMGSEAGLYPMTSKTGIQIMSTNLLLPNETDPVIWRGPVISGVVQQFWTDVLWNCDYLFVDMPPSSGPTWCGTSTISLWICLREPATCPFPCSSPFRWTASSSWPLPRSWSPWWWKRPSKWRR